MRRVQNKSSPSHRPTFRDFFSCDVRGPPPKKTGVGGLCPQCGPQYTLCEVPSSWLTKFVLFEAPLPPLVHFTLLWLRELRVQGAFLCNSLIHRRTFGDASCFVKKKEDWGMSSHGSTVRHHMPLRCTRRTCSSSTWQREHFVAAGRLTQSATSVRTRTERHVG